MIKTPLIFILVCFGVSATNTATDNQKFIVRGRVIFSQGTAPPIEPDAKLYVELQDVTLRNKRVPPIVTTMVSRVRRFPVRFILRYTANDVADVAKGHTYSIQVHIMSQDGKNLLFINSNRINITPLGNNRTKMIDIPVIALPRRPVEEPANFFGDKSSYLPLTDRDVKMFERYKSSIDSKIRNTFPSIPADFQLKPVSVFSLQACATFYNFKVALPGGQFAKVSFHVGGLQPMMPDGKPNRTPIEPSIDVDSTLTATAYD